MQTQSTSIVKNQYDLILEFARTVVPLNWNVYWSWAAKSYLRNDRHVCNVQLRPDPFRDILKDDLFATSHYLRWCDGVMFTQVYVDTDDYDLEEAILHELAHVAEQRCIMLKEGGFRRKGASICGALYSHANMDDIAANSRPEPAVLTVYKYGDHGELFQRCLSALRSRAKSRGATLDFAELFALPR